MFLLHSNPPSSFLGPRKRSSVPVPVFFRRFSPKMPHGTLEVLLVCAKGLDNTDFLSSIDPYVILTCRTQEPKSGVASGEKGCESDLNEIFVFNVNEGASELHLKIMDKDTFTADDFVGEATIPLDAVFEAGKISTTAYNVVKDEEYRGEIRVSLTFTPQDRRERGYEGEI